MTLWDKLFGSDVNSQKNTSSRKGKKSSRFYYESGERDNLQLFKGLTPTVKVTLRSLYLEKCHLEAITLVSSIDGCVNLTTMRLLEVSVYHDSVESPMGRFSKLILPQLKILYVSDYSDKCRAIFNRPFHKVSSQDELTEQGNLAAYNVEFYSQFLQHQLSRLGCRLLVNAKLYLMEVDLSISLNGFKILKFSPLDGFEKLVISPWLDTMKNQFLRDPSDRMGVKHLACSDSILTVPKCPESLHELNLFVFKDHHPSLVTELQECGKLSHITSLTLQLHHRTIVDISVLSDGLRKLNDLAITNAVIHGSSRRRPLSLDCCYFDQCVFSEAFITNVPSYLNSVRIAVDVLPTPNWSELLRPKLMLVEKLIMLAVYQVSTDEQGQEEISDAVMYVKRPRDDEQDVWVEKEFTDVVDKRHIFFNHRDFFQDRADPFLPAGEHPSPPRIPKVTSVLDQNPQTSSNFVSLLLMGAAAYFIFYFFLDAPAPAGK